MKIWLYLGLAVSIGFALLLLSIVGIQPKPVRLIKPSKFENHMHIGQAIYQRLFPNLNESSIIIFVSHPQLSGHDKIWAGVLAAMAKYNKYELDLLEVKRPESIQEHYSFDRVLDSNNPHLAIEYVREYLRGENAGKKLIFHTNLKTYESLTELKEYIDSEILGGRPLIAIFQSYFFLEESELQVWPRTCSHEDKDLSNQLICLSEKISRKYFSKKLARENLTATLEQFSTQKFAVFFTP